jgi:hypothetical protein
LKFTGKCHKSHKLPTEKKLKVLFFFYPGGVHVKIQVYADNEHTGTTNINLFNFVIKAAKTAPYFPYFFRQLEIPDFGFPLCRSLHHHRKPLPPETELQ